MYIDAKVYQIFFEILKKKFIENEWGNELPKNIKSANSRGVWEKEGQKKGSYRVTELFSGGQTDSHMYFQRRHEDLNPLKTLGGSIDNLSFYKALEYIGIKPGPEKSVKWEGRPTQEKAEILYHHFLADYQEQLPSYDEITFRPKGAGKIIPTINGELENSSTMGARLTIQRFYEHLAIQNTDSAWALLSPAMQNKQPWNGDFKKFHTGYTNTYAIKDVNVFGLKQQQPEVIECSVLYEDHVLTHTNKDLSNLDVLTITDLDEFVQKVRSLKATLETKQVPFLEKIPLTRLFDPTALEFIWYTCGIDPYTLPDIFPINKTQIIRRLAIVTCCVVEGNWLINRIQTMRSLSTR